MLQEEGKDVVGLLVRLMAGTMLGNSVSIDESIKRLFLVGCRLLEIKGDFLFEVLGGLWKYPLLPLIFAGLKMLTTLMSS